MVRKVGPYEIECERKVEELLAKARRVGDCLICHLTPNAKGYVPVQPGGRLAPKWRANRLVYLVKKGPIPPGLLVCHSCDVRNCIEPAHLFLGTDQDNMTDKKNKGRCVNGGKTKVTQPMYLDFVRRNALGESNVSIARSYNISHETVRAYLNGTFSFPARD